MVKCTESSGDAARIRKFRPSRKLGPPLTTAENLAWLLYPKTKEPEAETVEEAKQETVEPGEPQAERDAAPEESDQEEEEEDGAGLDRFATHDPLTSHGPPAGFRMPFDSTPTLAQMPRRPRTVQRRFHPRLRPLPARRRRDAERHSAMVERLMELERQSG